MATRPLTFELPADTADALESIARTQHREPGALLEEIIGSYLSLREYQKAQILEGLRQADEGRVTPHEKVKSIARGWSKAE